MQSLLLAKNPMFGSFNKGIYLFTIPIHYYALCIVTGMILAAALSALLMKRRNMSSDFVFLLFVVCIPSAIICARLFYCITDGMPIEDWYKITDGGLSIIGGVIGGVGAGFLVCLIKKVNFFRAADCVVVNILIAQALGRWGNFFNGEVYGGVVTNPNLQFFPFAVPIAPGCSGIEGFSAPNATWHYAFFFYEMLLNLLGWALLFTFMWKRKKKPNGVATFAYFVWYGAVRMVMEPLRDPQYILQAGGVPWSLIFSVLLFGLGICAILVLLIVNMIKEGSFTGSRRGDPCGISTYLTPYKDDKPYYSKINMFGYLYPPKPAKKGKEELNTVELPPDQPRLEAGTQPLHELKEEPSRGDDEGEDKQE